MTERELEHNVFSLIVSDSLSGDRHLVLLKPLAEGRGGLAHIGGEIWADETEAGYRCVEGFLAGTIGGPALADACRSALGVSRR